MNEEAGFLSAIRQEPADETARLVYADWLDEQGDPANVAKATFIRVELPLADEDPEQLHQLARTLPQDWVMDISRPRLDFCRFRLVRPCPGRWDLLSPNATSQTRYCGTCAMPVVFCHTGAEGIMQMNGRFTVVFSPAVSPAFLERTHPPSPYYPPGMVHIATELPDRVRLPRRCPEWHETQEALKPPVPDESDGPQRSGNGVPSRLQPRRKGGRVRNRNIQRGDWEEQE